jgi:hypothetical protein
MFNGEGTGAPVTLNNDLLHEDMTMHPEVAAQVRN